MGAPAEELLAKLEPGVETAAGKVRGLAAAVPSLTGAGWVTTRKQGRTLMVSLTDAGVERRASLPPPAAKPPRAGASGARAKAPTPAQRLAALETTVAALTARLAALEGARPVGPASGPPLGDLVLDAVGELDARHRYGGLVPLPDVRAELRRRGVAADDATVNSALDALERAWKIDLSVAQSPTQVADRAAGIERPGRGLLYYVARR